MEGFWNFCKTIGLHPLVGFGMAAVDWMLFGGEMASAGVSWGISVPIAIALTIPCILIQRYSFKDEWGTAIGKGLLIGVLTAIPTAIPSIVALIGGSLGMVKGLLDEQNS